jgi:Bicoid-interacting protein 3 (Bin3)
VFVAVSRFRIMSLWKFSGDYNVSVSLIENRISSMCMTVCACKQLLCSQNFTMALYEHLTAKDEEKKDVPLDVRILGIDIDPLLIERSVESNLYTSNICFKVADILSKDDCCNVIVKYLDQHCVRRFNIVFALSITMWIHLNNGDDGLQKFLRYVSSISEFLLVEPQPWHCYQSAARRMKKLGCAPFEHLTSLQWRSNVEQEIVKYLESDACNMTFVRSFGQTESWDRSLYLFKSSHSD